MQNAVIIITLKTEMEQNEEEAVQKAVIINTLKPDMEQNEEEAGAECCRRKVMRRQVQSSVIITYEWDMEENKEELGAERCNCHYTENGHGGEQGGIRCRTL